MLYDRLGESIHTGNVVMQVGGIGALLVIVTFYSNRYGELCFSGYWMDLDCGLVTYAQFCPSLENGLTVNWEVVMPCRSVID